MRAKRFGTSEASAAGPGNIADSPMNNDDADRHSDVRITDEVPLPMKDKKPVDKRPNAADSFWDNHQAEYDDREQPPNRCGYVDSHNDACPKMKDELDKKDEVSKPTACQTSYARVQLWPAAGVRCATQTLVSQRDCSGRKCIMCSNKKRYARARSRRSPRYQKKSRVSRVSKSRRRPAKRRVLKINRAKVTSESPVSLDRPNPEAKSRVSGVEQESTRYPDSSRASLSSYNSYLSLGHEPMVSE